MTVNLSDSHNLKDLENPGQARLNVIRILIVVSNINQVLVETNCYVCVITCMSKEKPGS